MIVQIGLGWELSKHDARRARDSVLWYYMTEKGYR